MNGNGIAIAAALFAQVPAASPPSADAPALELVIRGGRIFDPELPGARPLGQLCIAGGRVVAERDASAAIPPGASVIDGTGCTVLPGFFDLHVHVAVPGGGMGGGILLDPGEHLESHAAFGVLHVVDLHHAAEVLVPLRERSHRETGLARLLAAGPAFTVPGGHGTQFGLEANIVTSAEEVAARFEKHLAWKPDVVKAIVEHGGWAGLPELPALDEALLADLGARTAAAGLPLFVHVWTLAEAKAAVRAGASVLAHGVYLDPVDEELVTRMKERDVAYVPTLAVVFGARRLAAGRTPYPAERITGLIHPDVADVLVDRETQTWQAQWRDADERLWLANLKRIFDAGVRVGTGTDCGNPIAPHGPALLFELALYVEAGLTPAQALRCATLESARIVRRERDFGSLAPGKTADVVLVRGDPVARIDDLWRIERVFKAGREVDRDALRRRHAALAAPVAGKKVGDDVPATLDDFDDGDLRSAWGGEWTAMSDGAAPGGKSSAEIECGEADGSGVLVVRGRLAEGFQYGPFAGVTIQWDPQGRTLVDASARKEIVLRMRGTPRRYALSVDRAAVRDFDGFSGAAQVGTEWQEVRVPLASLRQSGFGRAVPAAWHDVRGLTLRAAAPPGSAGDLGEFELEIDWIRFD